MNPLYSVRFRLFALCISLLVVLGGANLLLGSIIQQHEGQVLQLQEQYRRVGVIYSVQQAMVSYRYWQGQVNDAILFNNRSVQAHAEQRLNQANLLLEARFQELTEFNADAVPVLRDALAQLRTQLRDGVSALANKDPRAEEMIAGAVQLVNTIEASLGSATRAEIAAAQRMESLARDHASLGQRLSLAIIVVSTGIGLVLTFVVLNSIIRPMQATVRIADGERWRGVHRPPSREPGRIR